MYFIYILDGKKSKTKCAFLFFIFEFYSFCFFSQFNLGVKSENTQIKRKACLRLLFSPLKYDWLSFSLFKDLIVLNSSHVTSNSLFHSLHLILFSLTTFVSDKCSPQIESSHGNKMGFLTILEQYENVNCDFNVSIWIWFVLYLRVCSI